MIRSDDMLTVKGYPDRKMAFLEAQFASLGCFKLLSPKIANPLILQRREFVQEQA